MSIPNSETSLYFDTNALIKFYKHELGSTPISKIITVCDNNIFLSPLVIVEFIGVITKCIRSGKIKRKHLKPIIKRLMLDINQRQQSKFKLLMIDKKTFSIANNVLLKNSIKHSIGSYDSIHLANYIQMKESNSNCVFVTSDKPLINTCIDVGVRVYNPETCMMSCLGYV